METTCERRIEGERLLRQYKVHNVISAIVNLFFAVC